MDLFRDIYQEIRSVAFMSIYVEVRYPNINGLFTLWMRSMIR